MDCPICNRRTPAARANCLYCGAVLPVRKIEVAPLQRMLESFESAFNVVLNPRFSRLDDHTNARFAQALQIELSEAEAFLAANKCLPVQRCSNRQEAELVAALIRTCGIGASVIADEELHLRQELLRARRLALVGGQLDIRHASGESTLPISEIGLLVIGVLKNKRTDFAERGTGITRNANQVVEFSEYYSDEMLLDVYTTTGRSSFRIKSDSFDYSGLVSPLAFRIELNFQAAINQLLSGIPHAILDNDFSKVHHLLARAWPERSHSEARGVKRAGPGYKPVAQSSIVSDNRDQFERYSRLMFFTQSGRPSASSAG